MILRLQLLLLRYDYGGDKGERNRAIGMSFPANFLWFLSHNVLQIKRKYPSHSLEEGAERQK